MHPSPEIGTVEIYKNLGLFEAFEQCRGSLRHFPQETSVHLIHWGLGPKLLFLGLARGFGAGSASSTLPSGGAASGIPAGTSSFSSTWCWKKPLSR